MTKQEFKKAIKKAFCKATGLSIADAKIKIRQQMKKDEYDKDISVLGVRLYYSDNPNYAEGGAGWYMSNMKMKGTGSIIKIAKSF